MKNLGFLKCSNENILMYQIHFIELLPNVARQTYIVGGAHKAEMMEGEHEVDGVKETHGAGELGDTHGAHGVHVDGAKSNEHPTVGVSGVVGTDSALGTENKDGADPVDFMDEVDGAKRVDCIAIVIYKDDEDGEDGIDEFEVVNDLCYKI